MGSEDRILEIFSSSNVKLNTNGMQSRNCLMLWNQKLLMQFLFSVHCFEKAFFVLILLIIMIMMILCVFVFQVPPVEQAAPIGSPLAFPGPIMLSPTSMPPGGAPFIHTEFDRTKLPPGKTF